MLDTATPITSQVGIEITGTAGRDLVDRRVADECLAALEEHGLLVFRDAHISDEDLIGFGRLLGEIEVTPTGEHQYPEIQTITMDPARTSARMVGYREGNFYWHFDGSTYEAPQKATLLSAIGVDENGGDTEFANTVAAHSALSPADQAEIADLKVLFTFGAAQRLVTPNPSDEELAAWDQVPKRTHPLVWTTRRGRKSLMLGATAESVVGWPPEEGKALLDRLLEHATQPEFVVRHQWRRGDLVMWDNIGMLHRALPFEPTSPRLLHRITLVGEPAAA